MIWSADTVKGGRVLFLLEFQRTVERLMALRTTTYTALTLEGIAAGADFGPGDPLPEFVYLVLYHGDGLWTAPARTADLFQRSDPGRYRLVRWREGAGDDRSSATISRRWSSAWPATSRRRIWPCSCGPCGVLIERHADPGLDGFMVQTVATMLELRDYPERLMKGGAKTMAEVVDRFQQGMDELVRRGVRQGIEQGILKGTQQGRQQGQALVLRRQIERKFGQETAGQLSDLLAEFSGPEDIDKVTDALLECATGEEFIDRVRTG